MPKIDAKAAAVATVFLGAQLLVFGAALDDMLFVRIGAILFAAAVGLGIYSDEVDL